MKIGKGECRAVPFLCFRHFEEIRQTGKGRTAGAELQWGSHVNPDEIQEFKAERDRTKTGLV